MKHLHSKSSIPCPPLIFNHCVQAFRKFSGTLLQLFKASCAFLCFSFQISLQRSFRKYDLKDHNRTASLWQALLHDKFPKNLFKEYTANSVTTIVMISCSNKITISRLCFLLGWQVIFTIKVITPFHSWTWGQRQKTAKFTGHCSFCIAISQT